MQYNPKAYWENRPNPNAVGHDQAAGFIYDFLRPALAGRTTALEVGPGLGRTLDVYRPDQKIATIDLSTRYADVVRARADDLGLSLTQSFLDDPADAFPFVNKSFEIGVCVQVLMHVPPAHIETTLREMIRTCYALAIVSTISLPEASKAAHVFVHDFEALFAKLGATPVETRRVSNTGLFLLDTP